MVFEYPKSIDTKKAKGLDDMTPYHLKIAAEPITPSITHLCNLSIKTGLFPN